MDKEQHSREEQQHLPHTKKAKYISVLHSSVEQQHPPTHTRTAKHIFYSSLSENKQQLLLHIKNAKSIGEQHNEKQIQTL